MQLDTDFIRVVAQLMPLVFIEEHLLVYVLIDLVEGLVSRP